MTRLIFLSSLIFSLAACSQEPTDNKKLTGEEEKELFRKEHRIKSKTTWGFSGQDRVKHKEYRWTYNQDGKKLSSEIFEFRSDSVKSKNRTYYNDNGQPIEEVLIKNGTRKTKMLYKYDSKGNLIESTGLTDDGEIHVKGIYEYNSDGTRIIEKLVNSNSIVEKEYINDNEGKRIKAKVYDENGGLFYSVNFEYDGQGNLKKETYLDNTGEIIKEIVFQYDNQGNETEQVVKDGTSKENERIMYSYDQNGNKISYRHYIDGYLSKEATYEYDKNDNLLYDGVKNEKYKYNSQGLRIEKGLISKDGTYNPFQTYEYTFFE